MKTNEEFLKQISEINQNIEILSNYKGSKNKIEVRCKICGEIFYATPNNLLNKSSCPSCAKTNLYEITRKKELVFLEEMKNNNPYTEVLGKYVSNKTHIEVKCKICGTEWSAMPCHLIRGHACPECANKKRAEALRNRRRKKGQ